jgi:DNA repair exonuclease SbcCD nuclease subunit
LKRELRLLHTSDVHLDDRIGEGEQTSSGQAGFVAVINAAIEHDVDLFLLAGDLFDHNRVKQPCLDFASYQLSRLSCPVAMITGNHDCFADYSVYHRYDPRDAGSHITFLDDEAGSTHRFEELGVTLWGRGIVDHHPEHKPLGSVPEHTHEGWYLGMTHGYYVNRGAEMFSSLITPEEIAASEFDYLALGHVHVFSTFTHGHTTAAYPGSPNLSQGAKEMTAALVDLDPTSGVTVTKLSLSPGAA